MAFFSSTPSIGQPIRRIEMNLILEGDGRIFTADIVLSGLIISSAFLKIDNLGALATQSAIRELNSRKTFQFGQLARLLLASA